MLKHWRTLTTFTAFGWTRSYESSQLRHRNNDNDDVVADDVWLARRKLLSYELLFGVIFWEKKIGNVLPIKTLLSPVIGKL